MLVIVSVAGAIQLANWLLAALDAIEGRSR